MRNQEAMKIQLQKKVHKRICVKDIPFLATRPPFHYVICCFLCLLLSPFQRTCLLNSAYKDTSYGWYSLSRYHEWTVENMKISCNLKLAELVDISKNVVLFPDFVLVSVVLASCSNLTLIKKSLTLNCYLLLQKLLWKTKNLKPPCWQLW